MSSFNRRVYPWLRIISSFLLTDSIKTSRGSFKSLKRDPDIFSFNNLMSLTSLSFSLPKNIEVPRGDLTY